jgi:cell division protein FtsI/penicillin-binding protein 2
MTQAQRIRIRFVFIGIAIAALILALTLYSIQVSKGSEYISKGNTQYGRPSSSFDRGTIYFQSKDGTRIAAATIETGNVIFANPKLITSTEQTFNALKEFLNIDKNSFSKLIDNNGVNSYKELAHKVDDSTAQSVSALALKGVGVSKESWRSYPGGTLSAQTLGLTGEDVSTSTIQGKYGLERYYQDVLSREASGSNAGLFAQLFTGVRDAFAGNKSEGDIVTTIEPTVEGYLEKILSDTSGVWHPDEIGGIVIDPKTGEIIAMASLPTFNANDTSAVKNASVFSNPLVEHVYEMGSILKPLTVAMGLDSGSIKPNWTYNDTGSLTLNGKTISNYDGRARGTTNIQTILSESLNVGAATIGLKAGALIIYDYFTKFGLGEKTGIDLPNEANGLIANLKAGHDIDIATASFGQGIAVSPIGIARALSVLGNNGYVITPHVVKEIDYDDGSKKIIEANKKGPVLTSETTEEVTKMLVTVVDTALKKGAIKNEHYTVAAKTGTAQIADRVNGGYYKDRYLHSFFGYFPAYDPKFLVFLYQIHPKGAQYASETLTEPFDNMTKFLINYYNIPPDR